MENTAGEMNPSTNDRKGVYNMATLTFEDWMIQCDGWVYHICLIGSESLPDWDYWSAFDDGLTPFEAAQGAIEAARMA